MRNALCTILKAIDITTILFAPTFFVRTYEALFCTNCIDHRVYMHLTNVYELLLCVLSCSAIRFCIEIVYIIGNVRTDPCNNLILNLSRFLVLV